MKRGTALAVVLGVLVVTFAPAPVAPSQRLGQAGGAQDQRDELAQAIDRLEAELREVVAERAGLEAELGSARARVLELEARVAELDQAVQAAEAELAATEARLRQAEEQERAAVARHQAAEAALRESQARLRGHLVASYMGQGAVQEFADVMLRLREIEELSATRNYLVAVTRVRTRLVRENERLRAEAERFRQAAEQAREGVAAERDSVTAKKSDLERTRQEQTEERSRAAAEADRVGSLAVQASQRQAETERRVVELHRRYDEITAELLRRTGAGAGITGLDPRFLAAYNAYADAVRQHFGITLTITSGFRTREQQAALYAQKPDLAAPPGRSNHERGLAIDHSPHSTPAMRELAASFELRYPMSYEPWHVEPTWIRDG